MTRKRLGMTILVFIFFSFFLYSCEVLSEKPLEPVKEFKGMKLDEDLGMDLAKVKKVYTEDVQKSGRWVDRAIGDYHKEITLRLAIQSVRNQQKILSRLESQGTIRPPAKEQTPSVETLPKVYPSIPAIPELGPKPFKPEP